MSKKILKENLIYQGLYQLIRVLTPIITIPIISRAFGPDGVGIINYSYSIIQYFLLFANVGIQLYFNKLIAECEIESVEISRRFWNIFVSKLIMSLSILVIYFIFICIFVEDNRLIFLIQGIYILG
ncbi:oligosaccharide flippase family protein, partial [Mammaliicoccus stepanovicii]